MELEFEHPRQPVLRKAPLRLAICQLRFPVVLGFSEDMVRPFQSALAGDYPDVEVEALRGVEFGPAGVKVTGEHERIYRFRTHAKDWAVTIGPTWLGFETTGYKDFRDFACRWAEVAKHAVDIFELRHQERLGLRYVNELPAPAGAGREELLGLVREELVGAAGTHPRTKHLLRSWQELRFEQEQGVCTLQHGYGQKDEEHWVYMLDFDYYTEEARPIDLEDQMRTLEDFNHRTFELFRWAIDDGLFESFEPEERTTDES